MKTKALLFTVVSAVLGLVGAVLHNIQIKTVIDPATGLAAPLAPVTAALAALSVLAVLLFLVFSVSVRKQTVEPAFHKAFAAKTAVPAVVSLLLCLLMFYAAYLCYRQGTGARTGTLLRNILAVFAALSGISCLVLQLGAYRGKSGGEAALASFVIVLFTALWLIICYKENAADPTLINYAYDFIGLCASAIAVYYLAGFAFGRSRPGPSLFFSMTGAFFCLTALPQASCTAFRLFDLFMVLFLLMSVLLLTRNLTGREKAPAAAAAAPEPAFEAPPAKDPASADFPVVDIETEDATEYSLESIMEEYRNYSDPDEEK